MPRAATSGPRPRRSRGGAGGRATGGRPTRVAGDRRGPSAPVTALLLAVLTGAAAVLRFAGIEDRSLWIDEAFSAWVARQPLGSVWRTTVDLDFHPPLYYALLHAWTVLGDGELALRSLSALLGVLTVPVVFLIGQRIGGPGLGLLSAALLAASPLHIGWGQQARMYTLMTLCAALSILFLLLVLEEQDRSATGAPGDPRPAFPPGPVACWVLFVLSTTATMLSHNTGVLEPVAIALYLAVLVARSPRGTTGDRRTAPAVRIGSLRRPSTGVGGAATGLCAAVLLWLPWLPHFLSQSRRVDERFWIPRPTLAALREHWHDLAAAHAFDGAAQWYVVLGSLLLVGLGVRALRARPEVALLLLLLVLVPVAVELLVSLRRPVFLTQTLVWTSVPSSVLLAAGLLGLRRRALWTLAVGAALVCQVAGIRGYWQYDGLENWRAAVAHVAQRVHPEEPVLFSAAWAQIPFDYYYERSGGPPVSRYGLPTDVAVSDEIEARMTPADLSRVDAVTAGRSGFWVVYSHDRYTDPRGLVPARLSASFEPVETREFTGVTVTRYATAQD